MFTLYHSLLYFYKLLTNSLSINIFIEFILIVTKQVLFKNKKFYSQIVLPTSPPIEFS